MLKSSLIEIIRTFSKQELIKFEDFVRSPYFNKKENVTKLFLEIKKYAPEFSNEKLEKEMVWQKVFPGIKYNYGIMKNLIFDLNKLTEGFIVNIKSDKDELKQNEILMDTLIDRKLTKIYLNKYESFTKKLNLGFVNENNYNIHQYNYFKFKLYNKKISYHHDFDSNFKIEQLQINMASAFISSLLTNLFSIYQRFIVADFTSNTDIKSYSISKLLEALRPGMKLIIESINESSKTDSVYIDIYYSMYLSLTDKNEDRYFEFKNIFFRNIRILPRSDLKGLHFGLITAVLAAKKKNINPHIEILEILDSMISLNLLIDSIDGILPVHIFNLYISKCFLTSDSEKLRLFVEKFINKLDTKYLDDTRIYVDFIICFINKNYSEALKHISRFDIPYSRMKIALSYQKVMCIYETDNYEMFLNEFDNLKHFNRNNKFVTDLQKSNGEKFYYLVKRLFILRQNFDNYEFSKLKNDVYETYKNSIPWFNEKLEEIEKANS